MSKTIQLPRPRIFSREQILQMYPAALRILSEIGIKVRHAELLETARRAGMRVSSDDRVFPDRAAVANLVHEDGPVGGDIPASAYEPDPAITLTIHPYPAHVHDFETDQMVPYTTERLIEYTKLVDTCAARGLRAGAPGVPADVPPELGTVLQYKIGCQYSRTGRTYWDAQYVRSMGYVMDMAEVVGSPVHQISVYANSPLAIGGESITALLTHGHRLQSVLVETQPHAGVGGPIHIADAITVGLAEALGLAALVREATGLPVEWLIWVSGGSPGSVLERWGSEEVTAFYQGRGLQFPYGIIAGGAKLPGEQAAANKMASLLLDALCGERIFLGAGNLGDSYWSAEQLMIDLELRDYVQGVISGLDTRFDAEACLAETREGVELGLFLALEATARAYRQVAWLPKLWGQEDLRERAQQMVTEQIARYDYELEPGMSRELERIYARAVRELSGS